MTLEEALDELGQQVDLVAYIKEQLDDDMIPRGLGRKSASKCPIALLLGSMVGEPVAVAGPWAVVTDGRINNRVYCPFNVRTFVANYDDDKVVL